MVRNKRFALYSFISNQSNTQLMNIAKTYQFICILAALLLGIQPTMGQNSSAPIDREFSGEISTVVVENDKEVRPFLGVFLKDTEHSNEDAEMVQKTEGVKVDAVIPNTSAEKAGLKEGDRILKVNGMATNDMESLVAELKKLKVADKVKIQYDRASKMQTTTAILMPYNEATIAAYKKQKYGDKEEELEVLKKHHHKMMNSCESAFGEKPFLGVVAKGLNEEIATEKEIDLEAGLYLKKVVEESAAAKAGLQTGDVITKFNGKSMGNHHDLMVALQNLKPEDKVTIDYVRASQTLSTTAILGKKEMSTPQWKSDGNCKKYDRQHHKEINSNKALLGVYAKAVDATLAEEKGIKKVEGLYLKEVIEGSAAAEAGLEVGDILLSINKESVYSLEDLVNRIGGFEVGEEVAIRFKRNNKLQRIQATLKANNESNQYKHWSSCYSKSHCNGENKIMLNEEEAVFIQEMEIENEEGEKVKVRVMMMEPDQTENKMLEEVFQKGDRAQVANKQPRMLMLNIQELSFAPNPNRGQFNLSFDVPQAGNTSVRIIDTAGKVVFEENLQNFEGRYNQKIDISDNYKGLYFVQIIQNNKIMTKKIVVQ